MDTLIAIKESGHGLWASCAIDSSCTHFADLDIDGLIARLGSDFSIVDRRQELRDRLRCGKCGRKGVQVRLAAPNGYSRRPLLRAGGDPG